MTIPTTLVATPQGPAPLTPVPGTPAPGAATAAPGLAAPPAGANSAFPALFLAMRAPPTTGAATNPDTTTTAGPGADATAPLALPMMPLSSSDDLGALPALAAGGDKAGNALPASGTDLPPSAIDIDELLASLTLPGMAAPTGAAPPGMPEDLSQSAIPTPPPVSPATPPGPGTAPALPANPDGQPAGFAADPALQDATVADALPTADRPAPDAAAGTPSERGMELALPAEFRARLDALINAAGRPLTGADGSTLLGSVPAPAASTSAVMAATATTPPASSTDIFFEGMPTLEPLNDRQSLAQGLGDRMLLMAERGLQSATIKLQPEHLGQMEIRIRINDDGAAQVNFSAQHAQTREALEGAIPRLRELFADQGLSLTQANVDSGRSAFAQRDFQAAVPGWRDAASEAAEAAVSADTQWRVIRPSERRVDVLV